MHQVVYINYENKQGKYCTSKYMLPKYLYGAPEHEVRNHCMNVCKKWNSANDFKSYESAGFEGSGKAGTTRTSSRRKIPSKVTEHGTRYRDRSGNEYVIQRTTKKGVYSVRVTKGLGAQGPAEKMSGPEIAELKRMKGMKVV